MTKIESEKLTHSLTQKLRERFGEDGRAELRSVVSGQLSLPPERICDHFKRLGWSVSFERTQTSTTFIFSQPPEASLPLADSHLGQIQNLLASIRRFISQQTSTNASISYPLRGQVSYRVVDMATKQLRSSGIEVTISADSSARLKALLISLPADPGRAKTAKLTE